MEVAELNHALAQSHGLAFGIQSIETFLDFLIWFLAQRAKSTPMSFVVSPPVLYVEDRILESLCYIYNKDKGNRRGQASRKNGFVRILAGYGRWRQMAYPPEIPMARQSRMDMPERGAGASSLEVRGRRPIPRARSRPPRWKGRGSSVRASSFPNRPCFW